MKRIITESVHYWEPRRPTFNIALALVVVGSFVWHLPTSAAGLGWRPILGLLFAAAIANVLYCSAYVADLFVADVFFRAPNLKESWRRYRWVLLVLGTALAAALFLLHD